MVSSFHSDSVAGIATGLVNLIAPGDRAYENYSVFPVIRSSYAARAPKRAECGL